MKINDIVEFDENQNLSKQTTEFQAWYNQNVNILINDKLVPDYLDRFNRPQSYTVVVGEFTIQVQPEYIYRDQSNWACSDFYLKIK